MYVFNRKWFDRNALAGSDKLGQRIDGLLRLGDGVRLPYEGVWVYNGTSAALVSGGLYVLHASANEAQNPIILTSVAGSGTGASNDFVVALEETADGAVGPVAFKGYCFGLVESTQDIADADFLKGPTASTLSDNLNFMMQDSATKASAATVARACGARTANDKGLILVNLYGKGNRTI